MRVRVETFVCLSICANYCSFSFNPQTKRKSNNKNIKTCFDLHFWSPNLEARLVTKFRICCDLQAFLSRCLNWLLAAIIALQSRAHLIGFRESQLSANSIPFNGQRANKARLARQSIKAEISGPQIAEELSSVKLEADANYNCTFDTCRKPLVLPRRRVVCFSAAQTANLQADSLRCLRSEEQTVFRN